MTHRDVEAAMLDRCCAAARGTVLSASDQREANVFRVAGMILRLKLPAASACLLQASESYFADHPNEILEPADVVRNRWIIDLPRLHDRLLRRLAGG